VKRSSVLRSYPGYYKKSGNVAGGEGCILTYMLEDVKKQQQAEEHDKAVGF